MTPPLGLLPDWVPDWVPGEAVGHDKWLKTNTVKHRTLSLLNQGLFHYTALPNMKADRAEELMAKLGEMLREQRVFRETFGLI